MQTFKLITLLLTFLMMPLSSGFSQQPPKKDADIPPEENYYRDLFSDTWVATDGIGRGMPDYGR